MTTVRQRQARRLVEVIGRHRHPSHQLLDRLEGSLRTPADLEAYGEILLQLTEGQRYPSLRVLDRLDRAALAHELATIDDDQGDDQ